MTSNYFLDCENMISYIPNALTPTEQLGLGYLIVNTDLSQPTLSIYGNRPKFYDTTFNRGTVPSSHYSQTAMTLEAAAFALLIRGKYTSPLNPYGANVHFNCNLVNYSPDLANGGSRGKHQDNPDQPLTLVLIYSFGQDRTMTFYKDNRKVHRVKLEHNSIVAMDGPSLQNVYHHQLDPLKRDKVAQERYSFNTRYMDLAI
jgi:hypothetical protein